MSEPKQQRTVSVVMAKYGTEAAQRYVGRSGGVDWLHGVGAGDGVREIPATMADRNSQGLPLRGTLEAATTNFRSVSGKTARTVRREGWR